MFSKQFITIPHSNNLSFRVHIHAFNKFISHFYVILRLFQPPRHSNFEWRGGWNNRVMESWTTWSLDFNKRGASNKRGGAKFDQLLFEFGMNMPICQIDILD